MDRAKHCSAEKRHLIKLKQEGKIYPYIYETLGCSPMI